MANPGKIVVEVGKALGKAVVAGIGLELARVVSKAIKARFDNDHDDDDERKSQREPDTLEALRRENASLRAELDALRRKSDPPGS
jgi:hypothetical protein